MHTPVAIPNWMPVSTFRNYNHGSSLHESKKGGGQGRYTSQDDDDVAEAGACSSRGLGREFHGQNGGSHKQRRGRGECYIILLNR
jgi:hypothetical protein